MKDLVYWLTLKGKFQLVKDAASFLARGPTIRVVVRGTSWGEGY